MSISDSFDNSKPSSADTSGRGRPHQAVLSTSYDEPERPTPCAYDPERWHPDEQRPDPNTMAACWSCFFQPRCALRALTTEAEHGIWAGYRLAPGPGLERTRRQLAIVAGVECGPAALPSAEVAAILAGDIVCPPYDFGSSSTPEGDALDVDFDELEDLDEEADEADEAETGTIIPLGGSAGRSKSDRRFATSVNQLALFAPLRVTAHVG